MEKLNNIDACHKTRQSQYIVQKWLGAICID